MDTICVTCLVAETKYLTEKEGRVYFGSWFKGTVLQDREAESRSLGPVVHLHSGSRENPAAQLSF